MKIVTVLLSVTIMVSVMVAGVFIYKDTTCRQKAWSLSFELKTRSLLTETSKIEKTGNLRCRLFVSNKSGDITWARFPEMKKHKFNIRAKGTL